MKTKNITKKTFIFSAVISLSLLGVGVVKADETEIKNQIINYVNQERVKESLGQLRENDVLNEVAKLKAQDMLGNDYFAHTSPVGVDPWYWFEKAGYTYRFAGENLGMDFKTALAVHNAWMKSTSHRENILSDKYKEIGVAVKKGIIDDKETQIAVQVFGNSLKNEIVAKTEQWIETKETSEDEMVSIVQSSLHFWQGAEGDEVLVSAEVNGDPEDVSLVIGEDEYSLEKLRESIYVNLIAINEKDIREESILIRASKGENLTVFSKVPDKYFAEYLVKKSNEIEDDNNQQLMAMLGSSNQNPLLEKIRVWFGQTGLVLLIMGLLMITILNIWILEREEERLLQLKN